MSPSTTPAEDRPGPGGRILARTGRLVIRRIRPADADDYFAIFGNPAIARYDDFEPISRPQADVDVGAIIEGYRKDARAQEFALVLRRERRMIGVMACEWKRTYLYVGYHINEAYHGDGYATEALRAFLRYLRHTRGRSIRAVTDPDNRASVRVLEKCGFVFQRTLRKKQVVESLFRLPPDRQP